MRDEITAKHIDYETPMSIFKVLDNEFHFTLDVAASAKNAKCERYFTKEQNGLAQEWSGVCWCNPPYGREAKDWIIKAYNSAIEGKATTVLLVPARVNADYFHEYCFKGEVRYVLGRPSFKREDGTSQTPMLPLAVVIFQSAQHRLHLTAFGVCHKSVIPLRRSQLTEVPPAKHGGR